MSVWQSRNESWFVFQAKETSTFLMVPSENLLIVLGLLCHRAPVLQTILRRGYSIFLG
jgi:hypothetical protein